MQKATSGAGWLVLMCAAVSGQAPPSLGAQPAFEVASVKPAAPQAANIARSAGGPGTSDPERFTFTNVTLKTMLMRAYVVKNYQISGPGWLDSERFDILAKVPPGATKEQFEPMLQNLLAERFHLTLHHEPKEMVVYELVVGKSGPKLKESDLSVSLPPRDAGTPPTRIGGPDKNGFPQVPPGRPAMVGRISEGIVYWTARMQSLWDLAYFLESQLKRPVLDKTGLTGKYDFNLACTAEGRKAPPPNADDAASEGGLTVLDAVQEQLGLRLESKKDPVDILVLDHIDRVPTDN